MIRSKADIIKLNEFPYLRLIETVLCLGIALGLLAWSLYSYQPAPNFYGPRAIYSLLLLSIMLALLGRALLLRLLRMESTETPVVYYPLPAAIRTLFLFDLTAPLYLAAAVLIGVPAAVITALVTQTCVQAFTLWRGFVSLTGACYRIASTALLVLISGAIYVWVAGPPQTYVINHYRPISESAEFLGSILGAVIMMLLITLVSLSIIVRTNRVDLRAAWQEYLQSSVLRFQLLVLSVGPLLPVVDIFDNVTAELAWLFFLVPLFAIYYLALISTRLSIRTDALQRTLQALNSARRRQDELRDYASLITRVQEEERRRLARELHDDTAQALIALSLGLDGLGRAMGRLNLPRKDAQWLMNLQDLADRTLEGVRRACRDLRPSVLDDLGLRAALEWLCDSSSSRGIPCTFTCSGLAESTSPEAEIAIFRIVQEALSNIWKHSHATQASVELSYLPHLLQLTVCDNGEGFSPEGHLDSGLSHGGLGLVGMRERAMLIGATLAIISMPGEGCKVELSMPC